MPKKRPAGIKASELVAPIVDKLATLGKDHRAAPMLEEFIFNKQELNQNGPLEPGHFKRVGNVSEHAEDARSVFLVKHIFTEIILVQKVIHKDKNPEVLKSIQTEIGIMHECVCPEIIEFYGSFLGAGGGDVNIVMEYMDAGSLDGLMERVGRIEEYPLGIITDNVLAGLKYLKSERHVIHRDMKPGNVLVNTKGEIKLCDFGVSRTMGTYQTKAMTFVGTVRYMSPERLTGQPYSDASDLWALGFMLIELATGNYPLPLNGKSVPPIAALRDPRHPGWTGPTSTPFEGVPVMELIQLILEGPEPSLPEGPEPTPFSEPFRNFVHITSRRKPTQRCSLDTAMAHQWIQDSHAAKIDMAKYFLGTLQFDPEPFDSDEEDEEEEEMIDLDAARAQGVGQIKNLD